MIECIFTIDYEIYGNGEGSLKELVFEPASVLKRSSMRREQSLSTLLKLRSFKR